MKGQIATPPDVANLMVQKLFRKRRPTADDDILDPGCGAGALIMAMLDWCRKEGVDTPHIVGVELDPKLIERARTAVGSDKNVDLMESDFLLGDIGSFDYVICNPPYVRIEKLDELEKETYRSLFETAVNRFDLYILFFEKALKILRPSGRMVFITPEKYEYTLTARPLRQLMTNCHVEEIHHIEEDAFKGLVTYPTITTINRNGVGSTRIVNRSELFKTVRLPTDGSPWSPVIRGSSEGGTSELTLGDICVRVSCGVATGADRIFVVPKEEVPEVLEVYAHPTVSGRGLTREGVKASYRMLIPYNKSGLLPDEEVEEFKSWFSKYKETLASRSCVRKGKREWFAFHENPPLKDILRSKVLCKDIVKEPRFWLDNEGGIVPRHSVYYIVPKDPSILPRLLDYLNSEEVKEWLRANCQRAANDFIRLQSTVMKKLPIPPQLVEG